MKQFIKLFTSELKNRGLSLYDKAVFGSLMTKYQYHGCKEFYTYIKYIADELEIGEATVKRSIKKLHEAGLVHISKKYNKQLKQSINYYSMNLNMTVLEDEVDESLTYVEKTSQNEDIKPTEVINTEKENLADSKISSVIKSDCVNEKVDNEEDLVDEEKDLVEDEELDDKISIAIYKKKLEKQYENLSDTILEEYNTDIKTYMIQFDDYYSIGYDNIFKLADDSKIEPNDVIEIYKILKETA